MSISVWLSMWPMWRRPVTLGGGRRMVNFVVFVLRTFGGWNVKQTFLDPVLGPAFFYDRRIVCFWQFVARSCSLMDALRVALERAARAGLCAARHERRWLVKLRRTLLHEVFYASDCSSLLPCCLA